MEIHSLIHQTDNFASHASQAGTYQLKLDGRPAVVSGIVPLAVSGIMRRLDWRFFGCFKHGTEFYNFLMIRGNGFHFGKDFFSSGQIPLLE
jgi:hypothetical protein